MPQYLILNELISKIEFNQLDIKLKQIKYEII